MVVGVNTVHHLEKNLLICNGQYTVIPAFVCIFSFFCITTTLQPPVQVVRIHKVVVNQR